MTNPHKLKKYPIWGKDQKSNVSILNLYRKKGIYHIFELENGRHALLYTGSAGGVTDARYSKSPNLGKTLMRHFQAYDSLSPREQQTKGIFDYNGKVFSFVLMQKSTAEQIKAAEKASKEKYYPKHEQDLKKARKFYEEQDQRRKAEEKKYPSKEEDHTERLTGTNRLTFIDPDEEAPF